VTLAAGLLLLLLPPRPMAAASKDGCCMPTATPTTTAWRAQPAPESTDDDPQVQKRRWRLPADCCGCCRCRFQSDLLTCCHGQEAHQDHHGETHGV
jgi:hypothetical protein